MQAQKHQAQRKAGSIDNRHVHLTVQFTAAVLRVIRMAVQRKVNIVQSRVIDGHI